MSELSDVNRELRIRAIREEGMQHVRLRLVEALVAATAGSAVHRLDPMMAPREHRAAYVETITSVAEKLAQYVLGGEAKA